MAMSQPQEPSKTHHRVRNVAGDLFDQQVVDLTDYFVAYTVDVGALNILT